MKHSKEYTRLYGVSVSTQQDGTIMTADLTARDSAGNIKRFTQSLVIKDLSADGVAATKARLLESAKNIIGNDMLKPL